mmetsp:Transcript_11606/g.34403  ORF Transcript_11606/g.34403 Transcript_11606/m.34403 type:complete len:204 (+) Transcript_11606:947-1558(+)
MSLARTSIDVASMDSKMVSNVFAMAAMITLRRRTTSTISNAASIHHASQPACDCLRHSYGASEPPSTISPRTAAARQRLSAKSASVAESARAPAPSSGAHSLPSSAEPRAAPKDHSPEKSPRPRSPSPPVVGSLPTATPEAASAAVRAALTRAKALSTADVLKSTCMVHVKAKRMGVASAQILPTSEAMRKVMREKGPSTRLR